MTKALTQPLNLILILTRNIDSSLKIHPLKNQLTFQKLLVNMKDFLVDEKVGKRSHDPINALKEKPEPFLKVADHRYFGMNPFG